MINVFLYGTDIIEHISILVLLKNMAVSNQINKMWVSSPYKIGSIVPYMPMGQQSQQSEFITVFQ